MGKENQGLKALLIKNMDLSYDLSDKGKVSVGLHLSIYRMTF